MVGLLVRLIGIGFALIQAALVIRLILPFIDTVPGSLRQLRTVLIDVTDMLIAPFEAVAKPLDLATIVELPGGVEGFLRSYTDRIDPAVVVAMIAWGLIGMVTLLGLRLLFRP